MLSTFRRYFNRLLQSTSILTIQNSFIMLLPIVLIGSFATLLKSLPIPIYKNFILNFSDGYIFNLLDYIYSGTLGIFSIYTVIILAYNYCQKQMNYNGYWIGPIIASLSSFMIMTNFENGTIIGYIGVTGIFTAIISSLLSCKLYTWFNQRFKNKFQLYADGTNIRFNQSIATLFPILFTIVIFSGARLLIFVAFGASCLQDLFITIMNSFFAYMGNCFTSGFFYITLSILMWFLGIHGSNVLYEVANTHFVPAAVAGHSEILTKNFFSTFISLGGCGATICLLIAILLFSKRKGNRNLSKLSLVPSIFNISELTVFGLPIILNPILFVPFLLTPIVIYLIAYFSMSTGLVPHPIMDVEWTTPIFISGYLTTNSIRGALLQLVSIVVGVCIYAPFIKKLDADKENSAKTHLNALVDLFKQTIDSKKEITLIDLQGANGEIAKSLALDLKNAIKSKSLNLYYQPQFNHHKSCIGAEALLRWNHPVYGMIFPPLIIKLAEECNCLYELETLIFDTTVNEFKSLYSKNAKLEKLKLNINVSVPTLLNVDFVDYLKELSTKIDFNRYDVCLEITEQTELKVTNDVSEIFTSIKELGYLLALDDFSMGHTSIKYLQSGHFDIVKLDGELIKGIQTNPRSKDIIISIILLSTSLKFNITAEYVETEEQLQELSSVGCRTYQGYLYSPAIPYNQFIKLISK